MDSITQAALGASIGDLLLGRRIGWKGAVVGGLVATIPDLDVVLIPFYSDLQRISVHRGYSHSIVFTLGAAFLLVLILKKVKWTRQVPAVQLWFFSWLALFTHILLDAFTSYGTLLFLPFTDWRVSFDSISIIDPVYTLPLIVGLGAILRMRHLHKPRSGLPNKIGLLLSSIYLLFTLANKQNVEYQFYDQLEEQNIASFRLLTVPVSLGNAVWYGVAKDKLNLYIGKYNTLRKNKIEFHQFPINDQLLNGLDPYLVDRMKWFAQGFYTVAEKEGKIRIYNMQCDMQGVRSYGEYRAPTAFYYEIVPQPDGQYTLSSGMHNSTE